jgi:hypothetical protein
MRQMCENRFVMAFSKAGYAACRVLCKVQLQWVGRSAVVRTRVGSALADQQAGKLSMFARRKRTGQGMGESGPHRILACGMGVHESPLPEGFHAGGCSREDDMTLQRGKSWSVVSDAYESHDTTQRHGGHRECCGSKRRRPPRARVSWLVAA